MRRARPGRGPTAAIGSVVAIIFSLLAWWAEVQIMAGCIPAEDEFCGIFRQIIGHWGKFCDDLAATFDFAY
jgi:hypothetical protein